MTTRPREELALLSAVRSFAHNVERGTINKIVDRLLELSTDAGTAERESGLAIAVPGETSGQIARVLRAWRKAPGVSPQSVAWALAAAQATDEWHRPSTQIDLVWTGPLGSTSSLRRTDQALLEVIAGAKKRLLVVSFAVYRIEAIQQALLAAVARGVAIQLVLETRDASGGKYDGDPIAALDKKLARSVEILTWPLDKRMTAKAKTGTTIWGVLHAKCALADEKLLFVSSANLTAAALTLNIELGLLVDGGELPKDVARHFSALITGKALVPAPKP